MYSPRKIAIAVLGLPASQTDRTEPQDGPPQRMCVDEGGKPTIQGLKFAEKWGVDFSAVRFEQPAGKKEPCAVVTITKLGRPTVDLLAEALPGLIAGLHVPKAMRWGKSDFEFVRPIRNILCLFGGQVVPITVDGVTATNTTWGHRLYHREHPAPVTIAMPEAYETALEAAGVVVSVDVRRTRIAEQLGQLAAEVGGRVVADAELLDTLAEIVEFPRIVRGDFPADFLELPKEVLVTSLREHQKSFCIENAKGELLPCFLTAANRPDDPAGFVKAGNEWVLKARLYDARFFFAEDRKLALSVRLEKLKALTFQRELGSYYDKTGRVVALTKALATRLSNDDDHINRALEAARMAKCDLRTLMVGEFPELQGIMGGEYLKHEGAHQEVWMAVKEHYRPVGAEDAIPSTPLGCLLSLCDKLDTVAGCFAVGLIPSGSKDPLALRRAGQGIVRILWEMGWALTVGDLVEAALKVVGPKATKPEAETREALLAFFRERVAYQLEQYSRTHASKVLAEHLSWFQKSYPNTLKMWLSASAFPRLNSDYLQRVLDGNGLDSDIQTWIDFASDKYFQHFHDASISADGLSDNDGNANLSRVRAIGNRLRAIEQNAGRVTFRTDWKDLSDLHDRFDALSLETENSRFDGLGQSAKRIANILKDETPSWNFDAGLLVQNEEKVLGERLVQLESTTNYAPLLAALADLADPLEAFFNAVMVKCEDPTLRAARLSLLHRLRQAFLRVADFSLWQ